MKKQHKKWVKTKIVNIHPVHTYYKSSPVTVCFNFFSDASNSPNRCSKDRRSFSSCRASALPFSRDHSLEASTKFVKNLNESSPEKRQTKLTPSHRFKKTWEKHHMEWISIETKPSFFLTRKKSRISHLKRYHVGKHLHEMKQASEQRVGSLNLAWMKRWEDRFQSLMLINNINSRMSACKIGRHPALSTYLEKTSHHPCGAWPRMLPKPWSSIILAVK